MSTFINTGEEFDNVRAKISSKRSNNINSKSVSPYLFWIAILLYTDIGGFQYATSLGNIGAINFTDLFFVIIVTIFAMSEKSLIFRTKIVNNYIWILALWLISYIFIFGIINNDSSTPIEFFIKNRKLFYHVAFSVFAAHFISINPKAFINVLVPAGIIIFVLFFATYLTGIGFIPIRVSSRGFIDADRNLLYSYSLLPWFVPLFFIVLIFKLRLSFRNLIVVGGILMILMWILSLTRRHLLYAFIYFLIFSFLAYKLKFKKYPINVSLIPAFLSLIVFLFIIDQNYVLHAQSLLSDLYSIITTGVNTLGNEERRVVMSQNLILEMFTENPLFGTGFNNLWRLKEGDYGGFEASDFPFLAALAMHGIIGLLFFMPIYYFIYSNLLKQYRTIKHLFDKNINFLPIDLLLMLMVFGYYLLHLFTYTDYFVVTSNATNHNSINFFLVTGIFIGIIVRTSNLTSLQSA